MNISIEKPSVQSLFIEMKVNGHVLSSGTAFIAEFDGGSYLVTNRHNLAGRRSDSNEILSKTGATPDSIAVSHNSAEGPIQKIAVDEPLLDPDGRPLWFEHPTHGRLVDVVALPLTNLQEVALYPYSLDPEIDVAIHPTAELHVVGFPFGLQGAGGLGIWTRGTIASEYSLDYDNLPSFLIDARTRTGQSGSPVIFHATGGMVQMANGDLVMFDGPTTRLVGVYSGRVNSESDLGIVWRSSVVNEVISGRVRPLEN